ncbi:MAG: hypothetical protein MUD10_05135, partial [Candidatus Pacebacteria bacterium]|nr:hypothetical protein [Candidatus Paceibacterota bacterium]
MNEAFGEPCAETNLPENDGGAAIEMPQLGADNHDQAKKEENIRKRELINSQIEEVLADFEKGEKTQKDFDLMVGKLGLLRDEDCYNMDHAWKQVQLIRAVGMIEKYNTEDSGFASFNFAQIFAARPNREKDSESVNDLAAKALIDRIEKGKKRLPYTFDQQIRIWSQ